MRERMARESERADAAATAALEMQARVGELERKNVDLEQEIAQLQLLRATLISKFELKDEQLGQMQDANSNPNPTLTLTPILALALALNLTRARARALALALTLTLTLTRWASCAHCAPPARSRRSSSPATR